MSKKEATRAPAAPVTVALAVGLMATAAAAPGAADEMLIIESTVPGLTVGEVAPDDTLLDIPSANTVTLVAPSGGVVTIDGPWAGRLALPESPTNSVIGSLLALFQSPPPQAQLGATRSLQQCVTIDLAQSREVCLGAADCLSFQVGGEASRVVIDRPDGAQVELRPGIGSAGWQWPRTEQMIPGLHLAWAGAGGEPVSFQVHEQPEGLGSAEAVAWMADRGCKAQAWAELRRLGK